MNHTRVKLALVSLTILSALFFIIVLTNTLSAGEIPTETSVGLETVRPLLENACEQNTHVVILGDSRTTINGAGTGLIGSLNYEFFRRYKKLGATPVLGGGQFAPTSCSGEESLCSPVFGIGGRMGGTPFYPTDDPQLYPPYVKTDWNRMDSTHAYGWYINTDWDSSLFHEVYEMPYQPYFEMGDEVIAELFLRRGPGFSDKVQTRVNVADVDQIGPWDGTVYEWETHDVPGMNEGDGFISYKQHLTQHTEVEGDDVNLLMRTKAGNGGFIEYLGGRWISTVETGGLAVSAFSAGGYTSRSHLNSHPGESKAIAALDPDLLFIFLDTNDAGAAISKEEYKANILEMIDLYRTEVGSPNAKAIVLSGYYVSDYVPGHPRYEKYRIEYPAALKEIATADPNVAWINGWEIYSDRQEVAPTSAHDVHLAPGIDSNTFGERVVAEIIAGANRYQTNDQFSFKNQNAVPEPCYITEFADLKKQNA